MDRNEKNEYENVFSSRERERETEKILRRRNKEKLLEELSELEKEKLPKLSKRYID
jgi:hypothetical protein